MTYGGSIRNELSPEVNAPVLQIWRAGIENTIRDLGMVPSAFSQRLLRVKLRRTQYEHMFSASPSALDMLGAVGTSQSDHFRTHALRKKHRVRSKRRFGRAERVAR
jgi:hypothetical protein